MITTQFEGVGADDGEIEVNKLVTVKNITPGTFSTRTTKAPQIQVWNGTGYKTYFYISDATLPDTTKGCAWATARSASTDKIKVGQAFWFKAPFVEDGATATFQGQVCSDASITIDVGSSQFVAVGNPYPIALTFDMITTEGLTPGTFATRTTAAPQMQVWNGTGYKTYFYISDATLPDTTKGNAWAAARSAATGVVAEVGQGFWLKSATEGKLTFKLPTTVAE